MIGELGSKRLSESIALAETPIDAQFGALTKYLHERDRCGTMANNLLCPCYRLEKMISFASCLLDSIAACMAVPTVVFAIEICAAFFLARRHQAPPTARRRGTVAVLIPAHDEAKGILATLNDIKPQLRPTDRLLLVADKLH